MDKYALSAARLESVPADEPAVIARIDAATRAKLLADYPPGTPLTRRDAHPKSHGLVLAEFIVADDLPEALKVGVFAIARTYAAWIRFSNGFPKPQADSKGDVRGMAIKVVGIPGAKILEDEQMALTQDFLLCNHPVFFIKDVADYEVFFNGVVSGKPLAFFIGWNPLRWHLFELKNFVMAVLKKIPSPVNIQYWSQLPYLCGTRAVKYTVVPRLAPAIDPSVDPASFNYQRQQMQGQLRRGDVEMDLMVQFQTSPSAMPIEDPRVLWSEDRAPFIKVATIRIPMQEFDTAERDSISENLSFTPWHSLPEHRPLGGIARARRVIYESISKLRHAANGVVRQEPDSI